MCVRPALLACVLAVTTAASANGQTCPGECQPVPSSQPQLCAEVGGDPCHVFQSVIPDSLNSHKAGGPEDMSEHSAHSVAGGTCDAHDPCEPEFGSLDLSLALMTFGRMVATANGVIKGIYNPERRAVQFYGYCPTAGASVLLAHVPWHGKRVPVKMSLRGIAEVP